ncbi:MAG: T9SS type A sorting domain-containing protein [Candidatus Eisenbacteria sp.]|nr:T9SS type A sorting domain-containing protein [Candidatus Eisenbacteria bacterium]
MVLRCFWVTLAAVAALMWGAVSPTFGAVSWELVGVSGPAATIALAVSPSSSDTMHVGSDMGGPYKSCDGGGSWDAIVGGLMCEDWQHRVTIGGFLVDPYDTDVLYKGGQYLYKSTDAGDNWVKLREEYNVRLGMDTSNPDTLTLYSADYFDWADDDSLFVKSTDAGATWSSLVDGLPEPDTFYVYAIEVDTLTSDVYAATSKGLYRNAGGDSTWVCVSTDSLTARMGYLYKDTGIERFFKIYPLALSRSDSSLTLYVVADSVYISTDAGATWGTTDCTGLPLNLATDSVFDQIAIHPSYPGTLYVSADYGLYKSTDYGDNWSSLLSSHPACYGHWVWGSKPGCLGIQICESDPDVVLAGRLVSWDGGSNWSCAATDTSCGSSYWETKGVSPMCANGIAVNPVDGDTVYFGYADAGFLDSHDQGTCCRYDSTGMALGSGGEDVYDIAIDPDSPNIIYASVWHFFGEDTVKKNKLFKSTDQGGNWTELWNTTNDNTITSIALGTQGTPTTRTIYIGVENVGVYKSTNAGSTWTNVTNDLGQAGLSGSNNRLVTRLIVEPGDDDHVFCSIKMDYTDTSSGRTAPIFGGVWETTDGGSDWDRTATLPSVHDVAMDPDDHDILWAAAQDHVVWNTYPTDDTVYAGGAYRSANGGTSWILKQANPWVSCVSINPECPSIVFAGCRDFKRTSWQKDNTLEDGPVEKDCKMIRTANNGTSWSSVNSGIDHMWFERIVHDPTDEHTLYTATWGGGIYKGSDTYQNCIGGGGGSPPSPRDDNVNLGVYFLNQNIPNPFNPVTQIKFGLPRAGELDISIYNILGQKVIQLVSGRHEAGIYQATWDGTNPNGQPVASGIYFCRMEAGEFKKTRRLVMLK